VYGSQVRDKGSFADTPLICGRFGSFTIPMVAVIGSHANTYILAVSDISEDQRQSIGSPSDRVTSLIHNRWSDLLDWHPVPFSKFVIDDT
jgi:hypothetical protein